MVVVNSDVCHDNNVVNLNTNVTIIVRRNLEKRALKHAFPHAAGSGWEKVNYEKFKNLLDDVKAIIGGSED